ncbi:MAG: InlB B-repeat-containing protein, partial [Anaeroplasma bactoclasticum]|nr:InlB B-repeat-containing protein [Anaeroplasma bactoclasticum]
ATWTIDEAITANITIVAQWEEKQVTPPVIETVTIIFNSNGGSNVSNVTVTKGTKLSKPTAPTKDGYRLVGWFKDPNGASDQEFNFDEDVVTVGMTLYAVWEISEYKVVFNTSGGSSLQDLTVAVGNKVTKPNPDPTKANYNFVGWYEDAEFSKAWDFNTVLDVEHFSEPKITIYAKFEEKQAEDEDRQIKFPFSSFHTTAQANLDSSSGKTNKELTTGQFIVEAGVKTESAVLNTQGKSVTFTVNGKVSNGFVLTGSGASGTTKIVTVQLKQGSNVLNTWEIEYQKSKTISMDGLDAGTYTITTNASVKITTLTLTEYNANVELTVHFNPKNGLPVQDVIVYKWSTVDTPTEPERDGYIFKGWYTDEALQNAYNFSTKVLEDITLYAKWEEKPVDPDLPIYTIQYNPQGGSDIPDKKVNAGNKVAAPDDPVREGYIFKGWYEESGYITKHDFTQPVTQNYTLHAKWEEKPLVIRFVGADIEDKEAYRGNTIAEPNAPQRPNYIFAGWYKDQAFSEEFDFNLPLTKDTTIYVKWDKDPNASDYIEGGQATVGQKGSVEIVEAAGLTEAAYITFKKIAGATDYSISLKNSSGTIRVLDQNSVYFREINGNVRADIMGVVPGSYEATVLPVGTTNANPSTCIFNVGAYDRSGYAHFNYTDGVGAYNDDGSLKKNAIVLWVTDENKNEVELSYKGVTVKGIGNILNSVGQDTGGGTTSNGGTPNTNQGIIRLLAENNIPLVVRFVGCVSNTGLYKSGTFNANSTPKIDGLTLYSSTNHGGTVGDNGHMARMKSGKDVTLEGVGADAVIDGWGFHYMAESSAPDLGKSFEVRNLTFINTPEDAVGMEGVQASANVNSILTASVERCWIHNNEFYGPNISSPAESDKSEGDGSCDFKRGQYLTVSYNYFEGCHKTNLVGSADSSLQFNLTYHHNLWYLCKARGPLARNANIHMYNNAFIGQTDYAMNTRANSYIFSEYNLFYMCKSPHAVESGAIKSYNDSITSYLSNKGSLGTVVTNKSQVVSNSCQFISAGIKYDKFDTDPTLSYIPTGDYVLQTDVTLARKAIASKVGVTKDHGKAMTDVTMTDISLLPAGTTVEKITKYPSEVAPGKMNKKVYAFSLDRSATVTLSCNEDAVLCNEAGVAMLAGNGSVVLAPGTYMVQPVNFQPGDSKAVTMGSFKDLTITSISFEEYNSEELNQQLIAEFEAKVNNIPATITYQDSCLSAINSAKEAYKNLSPELKTRVSETYAKVTTAYANYLSLGVTYVEGLINAIGTVNANSGSAISSARAAYNTLTKTDSSVQVSNLSTLTAAEAAFTSYAVDSCIAKIEAIGTVTLESKAAIMAARNEYNALSAENKNKITNRQKLFDAEAEYTNLEALDHITNLIASVNLTDLASCQEVIDAYNELSDEQKNLLDDKDKLSSIFVARVDLLIAAIPATIDINDSDAIYAAETAYNALTLAEQAKVKDYAKLQSALQQLDEIGEARLLVSTIDATNFTIEGSATAVSVSHPLIYTSKFKIKNPTKILLSVSVGDKGTSGYKISYSTDKNNWTEISSETGFSSKTMDFTIEPTTAISGDVYIKIECTCSKADKNQKTYNVTKLEIYGYGSLKYDA